MTEAACGWGGWPHRSHQLLAPPSHPGTRSTAPACLLRCSVCICPAHPPSCQVVWLDTVAAKARYGRWIGGVLSELTTFPKTGRARGGAAKQQQQQAAEEEEEGEGGALDDSERHWVYLRRLRWGALGQGRRGGRGMPRTDATPARMLKLRLLVPGAGTRCCWGTTCRPRSSRSGSSGAAAAQPAACPTAALLWPRRRRRAKRQGCRPTLSPLM